MHGRHELNLQPHINNFVSCQSSYEAGTDKSSMYRKSCEWLLNKEKVNPV